MSGNRISPKNGTDSVCMVANRSNDAIHQGSVPFFGQCRWSRLSDGVLLGMIGMWGCVVASAADDDNLVDGQAAPVQTSTNVVRVQVVNKAAPLNANVPRKNARGAVIMEEKGGLDIGAKLDGVVQIQNGAMIQVIAINNFAAVNAGNGIHLIQNPVDQMTDEQFDRLIAWNKAAIKRTDWQIDADRQQIINELELVCQLTTQQKQKLELVGRADKKRLFHQVEEVRQRCRSGAIPLNSANNQLQVLHSKVFGLLGPESFFAKVLQNVLTEEQQKKLDEHRKSGDADRVKRLFHQEF